MIVGLLCLAVVCLLAAGLIWWGSFYKSSVQVAEPDEVLAWRAEMRAAVALRQKQKPETPAERAIRVTDARNLYDKFEAERQTNVIGNTEGSSTLRGYTPNYGKGDV